MTANNIDYHDTERSKTDLWILDKKNDLFWVFGGGIVSLVLIAPVLLWPALIPIIFWTWALFFDGTHIWATWSRTYIDTEFRQQRRALMYGSLVFVMLPFVFVIADNTWPDRNIIYYFLSFALLWSYHHITRQHYGFVSLYDRKAQTGARAHAINKWSLYLGLWIPYLHLGMNHPLNIKLFELQGFHQTPLISQLMFWLPVIASLLILGITLYRYALTRRSGQTGIAIPFLLLCLVCHNTLLYGYGALEPLYPAASNPAQHFMVLTVMLTLFHNVQYHAIVWRYHSRNYTDTARNRAQHGLASKMNKSLWHYLAWAVLFSAIYVYAEWLMGDYPSVTGAFTAGQLNLWALAVWWGLSLHHFYLDQRIWRTGSSKQLQKTLV